jgi:3-oxoacyl-[acyl-carrier protein] reductase
VTTRLRKLDLASVASTRRRYLTIVATYLRGTNPVSGDGPDGYTALRAQDATAVVADIVAADRRAVAVEIDLTDPTSVPALFDRAEADLGPVDILVNNASVFFRAHCSRR